MLHYVFKAVNEIADLWFRWNASKTHTASTVSIRSAPIYLCTSYRVSGYFFQRHEIHTKAWLTSLRCSFREPCVLTRHEVPHVQLVWKQIEDIWFRNPGKTSSKSNDFRLIQNRKWLEDDIQPLDGWLLFRVSCGHLGHCMFPSGFFPWAAYLIFSLFYPLSLSVVASAIVCVIITGARYYESLI